MFCDEQIGTRCCDVDAVVKDAVVKFCALSFTSFTFTGDIFHGGQITRLSFGRYLNTDMGQKAGNYFVARAGNKSKTIQPGHMRSSSRLQDIKESINHGRRT